MICLQADLEKAGILGTVQQYMASEKELKPYVGGVITNEYIF